MADILRQFVTTAATATMVAPMIKMVNAMSTIQSSPIDKAATQHNWLFGLYFVLLLVIAVMTWVVWKSGNRVQDLIRKDADARLAESNAEAKRAGESAAKADERAGLANAEAARAKESAATANERAEKLENDNLALRGQVASLETTAAEAKTAQLRMEKSLEETRAHTVQALTRANDAAQAAWNEKMEREWSERLMPLPRILNLTRSAEYRDKLRAFSDTDVVLVTLPDTEPTRTAQMIARMLRDAGWNVRGIEQMAGTTDLQIPDGVNIEVAGSTRPGPRQSPLVPAIEALREVLLDSRIEAQAHNAAQGAYPAGFSLPDLPPNIVRVVVGLKPDSFSIMRRMNEENPPRHPR